MEKFEESDKPLLVPKPTRSPEAEIREILTSIMSPLAAPHEEQVQDVYPPEFEAVSGML